MRRANYKIATGVTTDRVAAYQGPRLQIGDEVDWGDGERVKVRWTDTKSGLFGCHEGDAKLGAFYRKIYFQVPGVSHYRNGKLIAGGAKEQP